LGHQPRSLVPRLCQDQPSPRRPAPGLIDAKPLPNAALGRAWETLST
jgi:hypothetical protein